jgi:acetolactate synthase I/II/III large subunit
MRLYEALAKALHNVGVNTLFGVMGDSNMFMVDSWVREGGGNYISAANEGGAVLMAQGFASASGGLGAATVTHGAVSNTITALSNCARGRLPVLVVAGDTPTANKHAIQNLPHRDLVLPTGAGFEQVGSAESIAEDVSTAVRRALTERRPILLNVPSDLMWLEVDYRHAPVIVPSSGGVRPSLDALDRAVGLISSARRPLILAGRGAVESPGARAELVVLGKRIGAPLATTLKAKDLFRGERHNLGVLGTLASPEALDVASKADCLIVFGAGLNPRTTDWGALVRGKRIVQIDVDVTQLGAVSAPDAVVVGDVAATARVIVEWLDTAGVPETEFASEDLADRLANAPRSSALTGLRPETVDLRVALRALERTVPDDRSLVVDGGRYFFESLKELSVQSPDSYIHAFDIGSIGVGVGLAIGACTARPDKPTLLVVGDGSFMLNGLQEFNTAVRHRCDLIVVVMNDGAYGSEHILFTNRGMSPAMSLFDWPDFARVAEALGGAGFRVTTEGDLAKLEGLIEGRSRPLLIDVRLDPEHVAFDGGH